MMLKKFVLGLSLSCLLIAPAFAQKPMQKKMGMKRAMHMMDQSVSGMVKGKVEGKMFMVANKKGTYSVDASKAKVRMNGRFMSLSALTGGSSVTVKGHLMGMKLAASDVTVNHLNSMKKMPPMQSEGHMPTKHGH